MIPLMKTTFVNELETKKELAEFILRTDQLSMGETCMRFEKGFAEFQESHHAILFNSGGSSNLALLQALKNLGRLKEGDPVGFSALTWSTNVMPIIQMGLIPVPVDCDPETLNCMSYNLKQRLESTPLKAFFTTNALGFAGDLNVIQSICDENQILLLEDNCESLGTTLPQGKTGTFGLASTFSFYVAHHMSTIEGGMVCTNDADLAEMLKIVRANGWGRNLDASQQQKWRDKFNIPSEFQSKYTFYDLGYNLRPTEITGFLGLSQLKHLSNNIKKRIEHFLFLNCAVNENPDLITLDASHLEQHSPFSFPVLCVDSKLKALYMEQFYGAEVEIRPMIAGNIQNQPFYSKYVQDSYDLKGTDQIQDNGFYFGIYPELTAIENEVLISCLQKNKF